MCRSPELRNLGTPILRADIVLVAADGRGHRSSLADGLGSGEVAFLSLEDFRPPAQPGAGLAQVRVAGRRREGPFELKLGLP